MLTRRLVLLVTAVTLVVGTAVAPAQAARPRQKVTWTAPATTVAGVPFAVSGRLKPARKGRVVKLQAQVGGQWTTLAKDKESRRGKVVFNTSLARPGSYPLRLRAKKVRGLKARSSKVRTVTVTPDRAQASVVPLSVGGVVPNAKVWDLDFSADGRFAVFSTKATNLVPGDTSVEDVFRADLQTGGIVKISRRPDGGPTNGASVNPTISGDGRLVAFKSWATDLYAGDSDALGDIYRWDAQFGSVNLISANNFGPGSANGDSGAPRISADGSTIAYLSSATNLVSAPTGGQTNVYAYDLDTTSIHLLTGGLGGVAPDGFADMLSVSASGDQVLFNTTARNVAPGMSGLSENWRAVWIDRPSGRREWIGRPQAAIDPTLGTYPGDISPDGRTATFTANGEGMVPGDTDEFHDPYLWSADTGGLHRLTAGADDDAWPALLGPANRFALLLTGATTLAPWSVVPGPGDSVQHLDLATGKVTLLDLGPANGRVEWLSLAADGIHGGVTTTDGRAYLFTRLP